MKIIFTFIALLFYLSNISATTQTDSVALENEYVKVMRHATVGFSGNSGAFGTRVIVALTDTKISNNKRTKLLKRGEVAVFQSTEKYDIAKGDYFEVAFKKNHPVPKGPEEWIEPLKNTIVYEDGEMRIFEELLEGGDTRALHSHAQRVVVRLNEVQLTDPRLYPNGTPGGGIQIPNTVKFAEPIVHVVKNLSTIPLFNIIIEFKTIKK
ncbi:MAG: hypothetical protein WCG93_15435 [Paludibacter sp.]